MPPKPAPVVDLSREEMAARVARWKDLRPNPAMFIDTRIPEYERDLYAVIGPGVSEDPSTDPPIKDAQDFNVAYIGADPGKGASLHAHPTVEVFIPLTGRWAIYWGEGDAQQEFLLEPWDCISVPPGVMRGFRNESDAHAYMIGIVGGTDSGKVEWAESVIDRAATTGLRLDDLGNLVIEAAE